MRSDDLIARHLDRPELEMEAKWKNVSFEVWPDFCRGRLSSWTRKLTKRSTGLLQVWNKRPGWAFMSFVHFAEHPMPELQSTVLLVEDEPLIRLFVSELLEEAGFKVVEAANATEALVLLDAGLEVNVLLTDVDMPNGCNGFELAHRVHEIWPQAEILIMSGRQWPSQGDLPQGAAFLAKPCPNETIVSYVQSAAERSKKHVHSGRVQPVHSETGKILPFPKTA
jgi:CheY-like chemotaxis protein